MDEMRPTVEQMPTNPQDRRTFWIAGRPYYFVTVNGRLSSRRGPSPVKAL